MPAGPNLREVQQRWRTRDRNLCNLVGTGAQNEAHSSLHWSSVREAAAPVEREKGERESRAAVFRQSVAWKLDFDQIHTTSIEALAQIVVPAPTQ